MYHFLATIRGLQAQTGNDILQVHITLEIWQGHLLAENFVFTPYTAAYCVSFAICIAVAFTGWSKRHVAGGLQIAWLLLAAAVWCFFGIFEVSALDREAKVLFSKLEYIGGVATPVLFLFFALKYSGREEWLRGYRAVALFVVPLATLLVVATNETHHLVWSGFSPGPQGSNLLIYEHGPWFWLVHFSYSSLCVFAGSMLLLGFILNTHRQHKQSSVLLLAGALLPWFFALAYVSGVSPFPGYDLTRVAFAFSGIFFLLAIMHLRFLDIVPVARNSVIEKMEDGVLVVDSQHRIIDVNPAASRMLDLGSTPVVGLSIQNLTELAPWLSRALEREWSVPAAYARTDKGRFIESSISFVSGSSDQVVSRIIILRDVTEQKIAWDAVYASEEKFRSLVENLSEMVFMLDESGKILYISPNIESIGGYRADELTGRPYIELVHPEDRQSQIEEFQKALAGRAEATEFRLITSHGSIIWVRTRARPVIREGKPAGIQGVLADITEKKKIEQELFQSQQHFFALFNSVSVSILIHDMETIEIVEANQRALESYGAISVEDLNRCLIRGSAPYSKENAMEWFARTIQAGPQRFEWKSINCRGEEFWEDVTLQVISLRGIHRIMATSIDITRRKLMEEAQEALRQKAEMSSRLATVGEMAAGIAHEINNPLTSVIGFSELLSREELPPEASRHIAYITEGAQRVKDIVRRMLTFARQSEMCKTRIDIHQLIDNTLELRSYVLQTANIGVVRQYGSSLPWVTVDASQIQQVLMNLIVNAEYAMKTTPEKGILTITTAFNQDLRVISITISDNGPGILEQHLKKVFNPFFTTKEPGEGTGLGLSVSRAIVLEHQGEIEVASNQGSGARFTIRLPVDSANNESNSWLSDEKFFATGEFIKGRVLVVDDESPVRELIRRHLEAEGHTVELACQHEEAFARLEDREFDLVLLDIRMPGMDGREVYRGILKRWPYLEGRVIFITGDMSDTTTHRFLHENKLPFVSKPFEKPALISRINAVLARISGS
jgi:PAS domain S-box-containing protein